MDWLNDNRIKIDPPKNPKKLTGTRFATILGLNPWATPFEVWCEVTRTYAKPFEDTIYTAAGKTIEPKQAQYMRDSFYMTDLLSPAQVFGEDYFNKTRGDFFPKEKILGGMWDYIRVKEGVPECVLEMKTTKRSEDWAEDVPEYYALQAALYAYLLGTDDVIMVASFLDQGDYEAPENYVCSSHNTIIRPFNIWDRYPAFEKDYIDKAVEWWFEHVESGISPAYDEKKDAEILKVLRTNNYSPQTDVSKLIQEAETLKAKLDKHVAKMAEEEKRYKTVCDIIKRAAMEQFRPGDKKVAFSGKAFRWEVSKTDSTKIDKEALLKDGLLDKYSIVESSYRITPKEIKEG